MRLPLPGLLAGIAALCLAGSAPAQAPPADKLYGFQVVRTYPHDPGAFTQGLVYEDGYLLESTGMVGRSSIRKVRLETGEVLMKRDLAAPYFGEGLVAWKGRIVQLTWQHQVGFLYGANDFRLRGTFKYRGEGWGLTHDGRRIIMSDGTDQLRFLNPDTLAETGRVSVTFRGRPVHNLNELEWIKGEVWANVWQTDIIVRINPATGVVTGRIDLAGILPPKDRLGYEDVLNGIAYDAKGDRIFVTGKQWPKLYQIKLLDIPQR
jgi:glutamine cyclotransferase